MSDYLKKAGTMVSSLPCYQYLLDQLALKQLFFFFLPFHLTEICNIPRGKHKVCKYYKQKKEKIMLSIAFILVQRKS